MWRSTSQTFRHSVVQSVNRLVTNSSVFINYTSVAKRPVGIASGRWKCSSITYTPLDSFSVGLLSREGSLRKNKTVSTVRRREDFGGLPRSAHGGSVGHHGHALDMFVIVLVKLGCQESGSTRGGFCVQLLLRPRPLETVHRSAVDHLVEGFGESVGIADAHVRHAAFVRR